MKSESSIKSHREASRKWRVKNRLLALKSTQAWKAKNLEKVRVYGARYRVENSEICRAANRKWSLSNRERINSYCKNRYDKDPAYRLVRLLRNRFLSAVSGRASKSAPAMEILGCPLVWLEVHLESLFTSGMSWENYGPVWHIDHIKPCAKFDLTDPEQQKACFHWTNLQPLFAEENLRKSDNYASPPPLQ